MSTDGAPPQTAAAICDAAGKRLTEQLMPRSPDPDVAFAQLAEAHDVVMALAQRCASAESAAAALAHAYRTDNSPPGWAVEHGLASLRAAQTERAGAQDGAARENGATGRQ